MRFTAFALILQLAALVLFIIAVQMSGSTGIAQALAKLLAGPYSLAFWLGRSWSESWSRSRFSWEWHQEGGAGMTALASALILIGGSSSST